MSYTACQRRYEDMRYRRCGKGGLKLSMLSLGLWHNFGRTGDYDNMKRMCFTAFDLGITHFDLADNYGPEPGDAERSFGRILREEMRAYRDEMIISTKAGYLMWEGPYGDFGTRKHMLAGLDQSLVRLDLPYVDIFYHHRMDPNTPIEETMMALYTAVSRGKALYAGLSNYDGAHLIEAAGILRELKCPFVINQNRYSIFDRTIENNGLKAAVRATGKGLIVFSPLAQGLLTDKYLHGVPQDSRIKTDGRYLKESALTNERLSQIARLNDMAHRRGQSLSQMALSWCLRDEGVTSVLIGASKPEQIAENVRALNNLSFDPEELEQIDEISLEREIKQ
jgi:L-glyceraldehyde 3-phosphate reductase